MTIFGHFRPKSNSFLILMKFCLYRVSKVLILKLPFVFKNLCPKSINFGIFGPKSINFLILTKFRLYPISKVLEIFESFELKFVRFGQKKYQLFNLNEIFRLSYLEDADFKSGIFSKNFQIKFPNLGLFGQKVSTS